ncbi:DUF2950 domain-containing protein, partial [Klebsiella pneumoniae]|nr:DUF2950 domain-containing protein [Klebsiella pneumoniae]
MRRHTTRPSLLIGAGALALTWAVATAASAQVEDPTVTQVDDIVV